MKQLHSEGRHGEALELIQSILERRPHLYGEAGIKFRKAEALYELSENDRAEEIWREIASGQRDDAYYPASIFYLARSDKLSGNSTEAVESLEYIARNYPKAPVLPDVYFELADSYRSMRRWDEAADHYQKAIKEFPGSGISERAKDELGKLNIYLIHTPYITRDDIAYQVRPGDTLERIARTHNTTIELIMKANDLPGPIIPVGKRLKLTPSNFKIYVDADENTLTLKLNGNFFKRYTVGTGEYGKTPIGEFKVTNKMVHPVWYAEDGVYPYGHPKNILGTRWIGLDRRGYGIHGTTEPDSIGKHETAGCVRMLNEEVEELYDLIIPGTPVIISGTALPDAW